MKREIFNKLFGHTLENRKWYHIIAWWEIRRIAFNIILLFSGLISLIIFSFVVEGAGDFIQPLAVFGFAFLANFFYTGGWITELFVRIKKTNTNSWGAKSFKVGLIISICFTFIPPIFFAIGGIANGERFSSPYSHFASDKPKFTNLIGTYKIDSKKADYISIKDKLKNPTIILNIDSTFSVTNFPIFGSFEDYELCNGSGKWTLDKHSSFNSWTISVSYDTLYNSQTFKSKGRLGTDYFIYNNQTPYKIYDIASDPDEWAGIIYGKLNK